GVLVNVVQAPVRSAEQEPTLQQQRDAFKACLEQQGVSLPAKPTDGSRPAPSDEEKAAMRAALEACASQRPTRPALSDEQKAQLQSQFQQYRACLEAQGLTMPERPAPSTDGTPPPRPQITDEMKAKIEAARAACADVAPNLGVGDGALGGPGRPGDFGPRFGGPGGPLGQGPVVSGPTSGGQTTT